MTATDARPTDVTTPTVTPEVDPRSPKVRMAAFFDPGSFTTITAEDDSDPTIQGGAMGSAGCKVILAAYARALADNCPVIGLWHTGGARLREGVLSLHAVGEVFAIMTRASGRIPQISVVLGAAAGGGAYGPALTDIVIMGSVTGEDVDMERLGGPEPHGRRSGVVHITTDSEREALDKARALTALLGHQDVMGKVEDVELGGLLPDSAKRAYDVHPLVNGLLDEGTGVELHERWAPNINVTLGRLGGRTIGVVANNPLRLGGCLDSNSAEKAARFVRMCDAFGVPLVVLVDVPGYLPGVAQEWEGVVRRGAKLLHAFAECVVPRVTVVTRKAYGGAYIAMNARALGATKVFAWDGATVAVMGSVAAVRVLHRRRLAEAPEDLRAQLEQELADEHELLAGGIDRALAIGVVDEVIDPDATRTAVARAIFAAPAVRGTHSNIPL